MGIAIASASSRSAGFWACRRPRTTNVRPVSVPARRVEDERLLERIRELHRRNYFAYGSWRMWKALGRAGEPVGDERLHTSLAGIPPAEFEQQHAHARR